MRAATDLLIKQIPTRVATDTKFESCFISADPSMDGTVRFATALSAGGYGSIRSNASASLLQIAGAGQAQLIIGGDGAGIVIAAILRVGEAEHVVVTSVSITTTLTGARRTTIGLITPLQSSYAVATDVTLVAVPITVARGTGGTQKVVLDATVPIVAGDRLVTVSTYNDTLVVTDTATVASSSLVFRMSPSLARWAVSIDRNANLVAGMSLFLRADVAYMSTELPLPNMSGPYLADVAGGKTFGTGADSITIAAVFTGRPVTTSYVGARNTVCITPSLRAGDLACWACETGKTTLIDQDSIVLTPDASGRVGIGIETAMPCELTLDFVASFPGDTALIAQGDEAITTIKIAGGLDTIVHTALTGSVFILRFLTTACGTQMYLRSNPMSDGFSTVQYTYHVSTAGNDAWTGTGLLLKPLFLQVSDAVANDTDNEQLSLSSGGLIL